MTLGLIIGGIYSITKVPLDAMPDITNNQVLVITTAPNLGTEDIEQFVTYQVELAVANLPDVTEIRSISRFGLSVVTIVFKERAGTYLPRQLVSEALAEVKQKIPEGFGEPFIAPISTGLGEMRFPYIKRQAKPITRLVRGPAEAIFASCPGFLGIFSIADTPPKRKRVMFSILTP